MLAPVWSAPTLGAFMAALPCPRTSTAGESALAAEAWLFCEEEVRFSTRRSLPVEAVLLLRAGWGGAVRLTRELGRVVAPQRVFVGRIRALQRLPVADFVLDKALEL